MKSWILRATALTLAAVLLPSCRADPWYWDEDDEVRVTVENTGSVAVDVVAETWAWWEEPLERVEVGVGGDDRLQLMFRLEDLDELRVRIYRATDGAKLFDGAWDREEIYDVDGRIRIVVSP